MIKSHDWCLGIKKAVLQFGLYLDHANVLALFDDRSGDYTKLEGVLEDIYTLQRAAQSERDNMLGLILKAGDNGFGFHMFNGCYSEKGRLIYNVSLRPTLYDNSGPRKASGKSVTMKWPSVRAPKSLEDMRSQYAEQVRHLQQISDVVKSSAIIRCCDLSTVPEGVFIDYTKKKSRQHITALGFDDDYVLLSGGETFRRPRHYITDDKITPEMVRVASGLRNDRAVIMSENMQFSRTFTLEGELNYLHVCVKVLTDALRSLGAAERSLKAALFSYFDQVRGKDAYVEPMSMRLTLYRGYSPITHLIEADVPYRAINDNADKLYVNVPNISLAPNVDYTFAGRKDALTRKWDKHVPAAKARWNTIDFQVN